MIDSCAGTSTSPDGGAHIRGLFWLQCCAAGGKWRRVGHLYKQSLQFVSVVRLRVSIKANHLWWWQQVSHLLQQSEVQTFHQVSVLHVTSQKLRLLNQLTTLLCCRLISENHTTNTLIHFKYTNTSTKTPICWYRHRYTDILVNTQNQGIREQKHMNHQELLISN